MVHVAVETKADVIAAKNRSVVDAICRAVVVVARSRAVSSVNINYDSISI